MYFFGKKTFRILECTVHLSIAHTTTLQVGLTTDILTTIQDDATFSIENYSINLAFKNLILIAS